MKIDRYKIALLFNAFPSYSISAWVTNVFVQPRFFSLPVLLSETFRFKFDKWNILLLTNISITVFIPLIGYFLDREPGLLDVAYIISAVYAFIFVNETVKNVGVFNDFIKLFLLLNFFYVVLQLIFFYSGFPNLTMVHSNIPHHVQSGYTIETAFLSEIPRYTGLFIESGPFTFFLCLTFPYMLQRGVSFPTYLKMMVVTLILFSQSKFEIVFFPALILEAMFMWFYPRVYRFLSRSSVALLITAFLFVFVFAFLYQDAEFNRDLGQNVPGYDLRLNGLKASIAQLTELEPFGKGLMPSNYEMDNPKYELLGLDAFSIVFYGYGVIAGVGMLASLIMFPVLASLDYKFTILAILLLGFMSSGSLIVPQYLFAITFSVVGHYQNRALDTSRAKWRNGWLNSVHNI